MAESSLPPDVADLALRSHLIGGMPIVNHVLHRLDLDAALERAVPYDDARLRLAPAKALGVVVRHGPIYAKSEWASAYDSVLLGLDPEDVAALKSTERRAS